MHELTTYLNLISAMIKKYDLENLKVLNSLKSEKLEIFLAGLPNTGKTTFLNAMLGLSRNELYESTKKATKCIFKISYGDKYSYRRTNEEIKPMPVSLEAKKELLDFINSSDKVTELFLPLEILKSMNIYDVPGLFSGDDTDDNFDNITKSSDLFLLLKNSDELCTPDEENFINLSLLNGSNYLILFSFGDMIDKEIKNNPVEFRKYFSEKISKYPNSPDYFIISSEEYYRNKNSGNINNVIKHLLDNSENFKLASLTKKIHISADEYKKILIIKLSEAEKIIEIEKDKLNDLYKVKLSREYLQNEDEFNDFKLSLDNYCSQLLYDLNNRLNSNDKTNDDLELIWHKYNELSYILAQNKINAEIELSIPNLPEYDEIILSSYDLENILEKINQITKNESNDKDLKSLLDQFKELSVQLKESGSIESKRVEIEENIELIFDNILKLSKNVDYKKVIEELYKYVKFRKSITSFLNSCQISYNSSKEKYIELFKKKINRNTLDLENQKETDIISLENKFNVEFKIDELKNDIVKLEEYIYES